MDRAGLWTRANIARDIWSTPRAVGLECDLRGHLVEPTCPRTQARVPGTAGRPRGPSDSGPSPPGQLVDPAGPRTRARVPRDSLSTPHARGPGPESPGTGGRPCGTSDPGPSSLGKLVDTASIQTQARVTRDIWSKPWALGIRPESPGTAGQPRLPADQVQVAWERCSTLRHLRRGPDSPGMLFDTMGTRAWA